GFGPLRAPRSETLKLPKPGILAESPAFRASEIAPKTASNASVACRRVMPSTESTIPFTKSGLPAISLLLDWVDQTKVTGLDDKATRVGCQYRPRCSEPPKSGLSR